MINPLNEMLKCIDEHTFDVSLLNSNGVILDLGSLNFSFSLMVQPLVKTIIAFDPNPEIKYVPENIIFENKAIVQKSIKTKYHIYDINSANSLLKSKKDNFKYLNSIDIETTTLEEVMKKYNINQFELIKFDIEGSEYEILENIDWRISKQYSIEFHDFRNLNPYYPNNHIYYDKLFEKMLKYCDVIQHKKSHSFTFEMGKGTNYWDSLFILKKEYWI
jgi:FkbM family methyltransferase